MSQAGDVARVTILHVSDTQFGRYHRFYPSDWLGYGIEQIPADPITPRHQR